MKAPLLASPICPADATHVRERGRLLSYFGGCDYYRLSWHPKVRAALRSSSQRWGLNLAASRKTTGNHVLYETLESELARHFHAEQAVLVSSGYVSGLVAGQALAGEFTQVLLDRRAHVSLRDAACFLGCPVVEFNHRDPADLRLRIRQCGRRARPLVMTDGMFAHDGSIAPLRAYIDLLPRGGWLLVDDAHAAGVMGTRGRGTLEWIGLNRRRVIQTITLSKAFGVYGGAILGSRGLRHKILARSHLMTGNTPLPLPLAGAALVALKLFRDHPNWCVGLHENALRLKKALRPLGLPETPGPIVYWPVRSAPHRVRLARALRASGIYPPYIRYPGGPALGYFRFAVSTAHHAAQLDQLAAVLLRDAGSTKG